MKRVALVVSLAATLVASVIVAHAATLNVNAGVLQTQSIVADIELPGTSTSEDDCKNGGHENWVRETGQGFNNQGQCISYVQQGGVLHPKPSGAES